MLITPGLITALCFIILFLKMRRNTLQKLLGFDVPIDLGVTLLMMWLFSGTFQGMAAAMIGGLVFSLMLWGLKFLVGYAKLTVVNDDDHLFPAVRWQYHDGLLKAFNHKEKSDVRVANPS